MAKVRKKCLHRWSKNGVCTAPGCWAKRDEVGESDDDRQHADFFGSANDRKAQRAASKADQSH